MQFKPFVSLTRNAISQLALRSVDRLTNCYRYPTSAYTHHSPRISIFLRFWWDSSPVICKSNMHNYTWFQHVAYWQVICNRRRPFFSIFPFLILDVIVTSYFNGSAPAFIWFSVNKLYFGRDWRPTNRSRLKLVLTRRRVWTQRRALANWPKSTELISFYNDNDRWNPDKD